MLARKKLQLTTTVTDTASIQPTFVALAVSPTGSPRKGGVAAVAHPRVDLERKPLSYSGTGSRGVKRSAGASASSPSAYSPGLKRKRVSDGMEGRGREWEEGSEGRGGGEE
jgi:hypothetical protein